METYKIVLILIVYTAALLLAVFYVYPFLKKLFKRGISIRIQFGATEKTDEEAKEQKEPVTEPEKQDGLPSVLGKSTFVLRQPLPHAATGLETENRTKKGDTFVPETKKSKEKSEDATVNYETGEGVEIPEEDMPVPNIDLNSEREDIGAGDIPDVASGTDFNELGRTAKAVSNPESSSPADEELAGKVLTENQYTDLVKSMQDDRPEYAKRITELMDKFDKKLSEGQEQNRTPSRKNRKLYESEDFKNFNIDEIS